MKNPASPKRAGPKAVEAMGSDAAKLAAFERLALLKSFHSAISAMDWKLSADLASRLGPHAWRIKNLSGLDAIDMAAKSAQSAGESLLEIPDGLLPRLDPNEWNFRFSVAKKACGGELGVGALGFFMAVAPKRFDAHWGEPIEGCFAEPVKAAALLGSLMGSASFSGESLHRASSFWRSVSEWPEQAQAALGESLGSAGVRPMAAAAQGSAADAAVAMVESATARQALAALCAGVANSTGESWKALADAAFGSEDLALAALGEACGPLEPVESLGLGESWGCMFFLSGRQASSSKRLCSALAAKSREEWNSNEELRKLLLLAVPTDFKSMFDSSAEWSHDPFVGSSGAEACSGLEEKLSFSFYANSEWAGASAARAVFNGDFSASGLGGKLLARTAFAICWKAPSPKPLIGFFSEAARLLGSKEEAAEACSFHAKILSDWEGRFDLGCPGSLAYMLSEVGLKPDMEVQKARSLMKKVSEAFQIATALCDEPRRKEALAELWGGSTAKVEMAPLPSWEDPSWAAAPVASGPQMARGWMAACEALQMALMNAGSWSGPPFDPLGANPWRLAWSALASQAPEVCSQRIVAMLKGDMEMDASAILSSLPKPARSNVMERLPGELEALFYQEAGAYQGKLPEMAAISRLASSLDDDSGVFGAKLIASAAWGVRRALVEGSRHIGSSGALHQSGVAQALGDALPSAALTLLASGHELLAARAMSASLALEAFGQRGADCWSSMWDSIPMPSNAISESCLGSVFNAKAASSAHSKASALRLFEKAISWLDARGLCGALDPGSQEPSALELAIDCNAWDSRSGDPDDCFGIEAVEELVKRGADPTRQHALDGRKMDALALASVAHRSASPSSLVKALLRSPRCRPELSRAQDACWRGKSNLSPQLNATLSQGLFSKAPPEALGRLSIAMGWRQEELAKSGLKAHPQARQAASDGSWLLAAARQGGDPSDLARLREIFADAGVPHGEGELFSKAAKLACKGWLESIPKALAAHQGECLFKAGLASEELGPLDLPDGLAEFLESHGFPSTLSLPDACMAMAAFHAKEKGSYGRYGSNSASSAVGACIALETQGLDGKWMSRLAELARRLAQDEGVDMGRRVRDGCGEEAQAWFEGRCIASVSINPSKAAGSKVAKRL